MRWWPFANRAAGEPTDGMGGRGEKNVARYLKSHGYKILAHNYTCLAGEIDLIALDGATLVFVEVKTRSDESFASPESAVNHDKRRHLSRAAQYYIRQTAARARPARFDVVAVLMPQAGPVHVRHTPSAFPLTN